MVVRRKPCTYLALTLTLSPNGLKQASTLASTPRSTIPCVRNDFWASGMFGVNRAPIFHWHKHYLKMDWNELALGPRHLGELLGAFKMISERMVCLVQVGHCTDTNTISKQTKMRFLWYIQRKPCTYLALTLTLPPNGPKRASTWAWTRSTIKCVQNDFWAYGMFGANHALHPP
jgi:hypothetical protein